MANMFGSRLDHEEIAGYFWILSALVVRALLLEREAAPSISRVVSVKGRKAFRPVASPAVVGSRSLSASLRRLDEVKHGVKRWPSA